MSVVKPLLPAPSRRGVTLLLAAVLLTVTAFGIALAASLTPA
jgi:hypothetical protein